MARDQVRAGVLCLAALTGVLAAPAALHAAGAVAIAAPGLDEVLALQDKDAASQGKPAARALAAAVTVVSASRVPVPLEEAPAILSIVTAEDLGLLGARTLADALRALPEVDVTRDPLGFFHVAIRGRKGDPEVLVLLDGQRINDFYDGHVLYDLPVALVEHIEIIRGPGSALYGTSAFAGVISIFTRRGREGRVLASVGSSGGARDRTGPATLHGAFYKGFRLGPRLGLEVGLETLLSAGPKLLVLEDGLTRDRFDPDTGASQSLACSRSDCPDSAYSNLRGGTVHATVALRGRPGLQGRADSFALITHAVHQDRGPFIGEFDTFAPDSQLATSKLFSRLEYGVPLSPRLRLELLSSLDFTRVDRAVAATPDNFKERVGASTEVFPSGQRKRVLFTEYLLRDEARLQARLHQRLSTTLGVELEYADLAAYQLTTNYDNAGRHREPLDNYLGYRLEQSGKFRTVIGVYLDNVVRLPRNLTLILGGRFDRYNDFGSALSPRTGVIYRPGRRGPLSLKLFFGMAFRAPTFEELYDRSNTIDLGGFLGNADLDASTVSTLEMGATYSLPGRGYLLSMGVNGFASRLRDSIDRVPNTGLTNVLLNSSDVDSYGAASEARLEIGGRHAVFGNVSWFRAESDYAYVDPARFIDVRTQTELTAVPRFRANLGAQVALTRRVRLGGLLQIGGERRNNRRAPLEAQYFFQYPLYHLLSLSLGVDPVWEKVRARLVVENLTDQAINDEPFRPSRMVGSPRDRLQIMVAFERKL